MDGEQKSVGNEVQIREPRPSTLTICDADISLLIEFFQTLDQWDCQSRMTPSVGSKRSLRDSHPVLG